jgi:3-isopropylmalate dehydrogenase
MKQVKTKGRKKVFRIAVLPGDGIGPEIMREGLKVVRAALKCIEAPSFLFTELQGGADHYRKTGIDFPEESRKACWEADAVYLNATGYPDVLKPDGTGISVAWDIRKGMDLFAAVRPVTLFNSGISPLKNRKSGTIRFTIIRENTEGIYASRGSGTVLHDEVAVNPMIVTRKGSERIMRFAFEFARRGQGAPADGRRRVTCVDKSNVLTSWAFFRKIYNETADQYPDIERDYRFIDAMALHLVQQPERFDVVVAENQHGDVLSDLGAALVGGLGFAPSANIGIGRAMFEPAHGTAPTIAGKNIANPIATILSGAMMLRWLASEHGGEILAAAAEKIEAATARVLEAGKVLTTDVGGKATTEEMGDAVARAVAKLGGE